jgi:threonine dehydrogenase-like Zn-dependent dehydrogenase
MWQRADQGSLTRFRPPASGRLSIPNSDLTVGPSSQIKPAFCGICGTDLHEYLGGPNLIPSEKPHPLTHETLPLTIGHEFSGTIEEVGDDVTRLKVGDRVCVQPTIYDGDCLSCRRGLVNCCDQNGFIGLSGWGGGMSEHIVVPQDSVKKLPDNVSLEIGALVEPLSVGWHAVSISPYKKGDCVLVLGGGPIGLAVVQVLRAQECDTIIVSEISSRRMQYAKEFGAHHVVDHGAGVDLAFDAAGVQVGLDSALCSIKARGMLVNIAIWEKRATLNMNDIVFRERAYMGTATFALGDFEQVIDAISSGGTFAQTMGRHFANEHRKIDAGRNDYKKDQDERDRGEGVQRTH